MHSVNSNSKFWSRLALAIAFAAAGCGQQSTPQSQFTGDADEAVASSTPESPTGPLSTNDFDSSVTTTAGVLPFLSPKAKPGTRPGTPALTEEELLEAAELAEEALEDAEDAMDEEVAEPKPGSPEYMLRQLALLKSAPFPLVRQPIQGKPGQFEEVQLTPEQASQEQLRRWTMMVDLAMQVISATKADPLQEQLFNNGVYYLTETRKQLALRGEPDQDQLLAEDAEALYRRDKTSFAAIESAHKVVQLTQMRAEQSGRQDPRLAATFAKQARLFAEKFPQDTNRSAMNLVAAGRLCEQVGLIEDAKLCFTTIQERYPDSPFQEITSGVLRRLRLQGEKLTEFAGSTVEGGYISIDQFAGHPVLIVFWASNSQTLINDLPTIQAAETKYGPRGLMVVGVNLDKEQAAVDRFVEQHSLAWQNIFFSEANSRGVRNPIAQHYGVTSVPTYWLVNASGIVTAAPLDLKQLDALLSKPPVKAASITR